MMWGMEFCLKRSAAILIWVVFPDPSGPSKVTKHAINLRPSQNPSSTNKTENGEILFPVFSEKYFPDDKFPALESGASSAQAFSLCLSNMRLCLDNRLHGAAVGAITTIGAFFRIDHILSVSFAYRCHRAGIFASTTGTAIICYKISHFSLLLSIINNSECFIHTYKSALCRGIPQLT
jgi:hypothetical protein